MSTPHSGAMSIPLQVEGGADQHEGAQGVAVLGLVVKCLGPVALGLAQSLTVAPGRFDQVGRRLAQVALLTSQRSGLLDEALSKLGHGECSTPAPGGRRGIAGWECRRRAVPS